MNTIKLSAVTALFATTLAFAGGDITPVQPYVETPVTDVATPTLSGLYAGLGYSCLHLTQDAPDTTTTAWTGASINLGYDFNEYLAIEGRYTASIGDMQYEAWNIDEDKDYDMSNVALYLKPQINMGTFGLYGLVGYGQTTFDNGSSYSVDGLQYGAGINVNATENVQLFVDYRRLYDDSEFDGLVDNQDIAANSWSVGANYKF